MTINVDFLVELLFIIVAYVIGAFVGYKMAGDE
jgi:hypothetical protein